MSEATLLELHDALALDSSRVKQGFSPDLDNAQQRIFAARSPQEAADELNEWLRSHQPCIFGRIAAKDEQVSICVLREEDLVRGDGHVSTVIEQSRRAWGIRALSGEKHSFLLMLATERIAWARSDEKLLSLARRLCRFYLGQDATDCVHFDRVFLRSTGEAGAEYRAWNNGVNVFCPQGDQKWWHDHRAPGGLLFTMNPVGHMAHVLLQKERPGAEQREQLLNWALPVAMLTIRTASRGKFPGSRLLVSSNLNPPFCPRSFSKLAGFDWNNYAGAFHTDHTLPTSFFRPDENRPQELADHEDLDFTYLHEMNEADYQLIGIGETADPTVCSVLRRLLEETAEEEQK